MVRGLTSVCVSFQDPGVKVVDVKQAAASMPNTRVEIFEHHKHWVQKESPRTVCGYSARLRRNITLVILNEQHKMNPGKRFENKTFR